METNNHPILQPNLGRLFISSSLSPSIDEQHKGAGGEIATESVKT